MTNDSKVGLQVPPERVTLPCRRCRAEHGLQTYNLVKPDMTRQIHEYACERCGLHEELTLHFARDLPHPDEFSDFSEAVRQMGRGYVRVLRIDRLASWLTARLTR